VTDPFPDADDFADIDPGKIEAQAGPLTGSRGTSRSAGSRAPRGTRQAKKLETLQKRLATEMFTAGAMIGMGLHVTGYYISQEADHFTAAIVELASKRPEWVEALEHIADIGPGLTAGRTVLGMGAALAVDRGRADPEKQFMRFLGVTAAWNAVNGDGGTADGVSSYVPPPGGNFVPVS
jgi:hypothetical protein